MADDVEIPDELVRKVASRQPEWYRNWHIETLTRNIIKWYEREKAEEEADA